MKNETPTPRTDNVVASDMGDSGFLVDMINHAQQLERELNEAKLWIEKSNTAQYVMQVEAERDQLRKVVDELCSVVRGEFGDSNWRVNAYSKLPHVIERKTK